MMNSEKMAPMIAALRERDGKSLHGGASRPVCAGPAALIYTSSLFPLNRGRREEKLGSGSLWTPLIRPVSMLRRLAAASLKHFFSDHSVSLSHIRRSECLKGGSSLPPRGLPWLPRTAAPSQTRLNEPRTDQNGGLRKAGPGPGPGSPLLLFTNAKRLKSDGFRCKPA